MSAAYLSTLAALRDEHALELEAVLRRARAAEDRAAYLERENVKLRADLDALRDAASQRAATVYESARLMLTGDPAADLMASDLELRAENAALRAALAERRAA